MADKSAIEWTDATWNPVTGCTKVSPACAHCYIERTPPFRVRGRRFVNGHIPLEFHPERFEQPLRRKTPTVYFVNSLSDLFHEDVPDAFIERVFAVMALARQHTFQILTKRPGRMRRFFDEPNRSAAVGIAAMGISKSTRPFTLPDERVFEARPVAFNLPWMIHAWPLPNVWLGVSVENQHFADERIPLLLQTPAAVRFISAEPLLGPVDLSGGSDPCRTWLRSGLMALRGLATERWWPPLDWIICGGESGPSVRPTDPAWVRDVRDQCVRAGVPFFFKQWGGRRPTSSGRLLDGRTWDEMPRQRGPHPL